jgi:hypothetical protein
MADRDPIIWVINDGGHPYHKAKELVGDYEIRPLTTGSVNYLRVDRMNFDLAEGIVRFGHPEDFLIISGNPMIPSMAVLLWILQFGKVKLLQWQARKREYQLNTLEEEDLRTLLESRMVHG